MGLGVSKVMSHVPVCKFNTTIDDCRGQGSQSPSLKELRMHRHSAISRCQWLRVRGAEAAGLPWMVEIAYRVQNPSV